VKIAALLLAAGSSRRFGSDKRKVQLGAGRTLLATSLQLYLDAFGHCFVVIDEDDDALKPDLLQQGGTPVELPGRERGYGMGDSLAAGIKHIAGQRYDACLVGLADMPWVKPTTLAALASALAEAPLVVPAWRGRRGHPVGFAARYFPALCQLGGDCGARGLLQRHTAELVQLPVEDPGILQDVDTVVDLWRRP
jgi:molybdenum cofactor cytidylyltransferase